MSTPVLILLTLTIVLAGFAFARLQMWVVGRYLHEDESHDEIHYASTVDGWRLALMRFRPTRRISGGAPILLCPGLCENHRLFDLTPATTFARFLADRGHDVFVANLRAIGRSTLPNRFGLRHRRASYDDYALRDAPALIDAVKRATGAPAIIWVGHSLGGLVGLGHAVASDASGLRGLVTLATSFGFDLIPILRIAVIPPLIPAIDTRLLARLYAPIAPWCTFPPMSVGFNMKNMAPETLRRAVYHMTEDVSMPFLEQMRDWSRARACKSRDGSVDYREGLAGLTVPALIAFGVADRVFPVASFEDIYERIGSPKKSLLAASRANGFSCDYGHADLVLGPRAPAEVYPRIAEWIEAEQGLQPPRDEPGAPARKVRPPKSSSASPTTL